MSKRKVKVEMCDEQDNKITITFEGNLDDKNLKNLITSANSLLGKEKETQNDIQDVEVQNALELPIAEQVKLVISTAFGMGSWFTTNDLCDSFQDIFSSDLKATTASTYLARLFDSGFLERAGTRNERRYKIKKDLREKIPKLITH